MFGSGPKKPVSKRTWAVQILTRDYLVEGLLQSPIDDSEFFTDLLSSLKQGVGHTGFPLTLLNADVRPAGNLAAQLRSFAQWALRLGPNVIAFVPGDDDSPNTLRQQFSNFKHPFPATLYAGRCQPLAKQQIRRGCRALLLHRPGRRGDRSDARQRALLDLLAKSGSLKE
jgi:hypothetical protein